MILRSIEVKGWRCFADRFRLDGLNERLNVVHGPNGTGKSTLFQAMVRGLLDNYRVGGEDAGTLRPWGRQLTPQVTIEFRHQGQLYRLTKQFLDRASATLERMERGAYVSFADGEAADDQVRQMLHATAPGRGLVQVRNWGLAQVLWTLEGDLNLRELTGDTAADIRSMLGAQFAGPGGSRLEQRIEALYGQFFTNRGALRTGQNAPEAVRLEAKLTAERVRLADAREKLQQFEERSLRLDGVREEKAQLARDLETCNQALTDARRLAQEYAELSLECQRRESQARAAEAEYRRIDQRIETIQSAAAELSKVLAECGQIAARLPALDRAAAESRTEGHKRKSTLEDARGKQAYVDAARSEAAKAKTYASAKLKSAELSLKLAQVCEVAGHLAALRSERAPLAAPDAADLRAIHKAIKMRDDAQLRLEAALIHFEIEPSRDLAVTVLEGEKPGKASLRNGIPENFQGSPAVVLEIEGLGRFRARGPAADAGELRDQRKKAETKLTRLTEPFGTAAVEELERLSEQAAELDHRADESKAKLDGLLAGETQESLAAEFGKHEKSTAATETERPQWKEMPPDAAALEQAAVAVERQVRDAIAAAERLWMDAENLAYSAATAAGKEETRQEEVAKHAAGLEEQLRKQRADGQTDVDREAARARAAMSWDAAQVKLREIESQLTRFPCDPADDVRPLERERTGLEQRERDALVREKLEEGRLSDAAAHGPYQALTAAEESAATLTARLERESARTAAIQLLWRTVTQCRTTAVAAVAAPVEACATAMLHRIAGGRLGKIRLDESMMPANLAVANAESPVSLGDASGGEREQIFLATRLALAEVLARDERQLVLLDDVLTATDIPRMARIMRLLDEYADKVQIVILTCHPERYAALEDATFFDMEEIAAARLAAAR